MSALMVLENVNRVIGILFLTCYFYQLLYVPVALWRTYRDHPRPSDIPGIVMINNSSKITVNVWGSLRQEKLY